MTDITDTIVDKEAIIKEYVLKEGDTGSCEVQVHFSQHV